MNYRVHVQRVEAQTTAVVRRRALPGEYATVVPQACGEVWQFLRSAQVPHPGRLLAVYLGCDGDIEVGAEVAGPFEGDSQVVRSCAPAGLVATAAHFGPYQRLGEAHAAVRKWCADHGHRLTGVSWELYGHWTDDETQLRTDVFYLLQEPSG
jgi:effector-binding domain-containing protein